MHSNFTTGAGSDFAKRQIFFKKSSLECQCDTKISSPLPQQPSLSTIHLRVLENEHKAETHGRLKKKLTSFDYHLKTAQRQLTWYIDLPPTI